MLLLVLLSLPVTAAAATTTVSQSRSSEPEECVIVGDVSRAAVAVSGSGSADTVATKWLVRDGRLVPPGGPLPRTLTARKQLASKSSDLRKKVGFTAFVPDSDLLAAKRARIAEREAKVTLFRVDCHRPERNVTCCLTTAL